MTSKNFNWHKNWHREGARLIHISGLAFEVTKGDGYTDIIATGDTLEAWQAFELARGVPLHDLAERAKRLNREAAEWHSRNPAG